MTDVDLQYRWDPALERLAGGRDSVWLGTALEMHRWFGWRGADGHIHLGAAPLE